jgi:hypothetical protein
MKRVKNGKLYLILASDDKWPSHRRNAKFYKQELQKLLEEAPRRGCSGLWAASQSISLPD